MWQEIVKTMVKEERFSTPAGAQAATSYSDWQTEMHLSIKFYRVMIVNGDLLRYYDVVVWALVSNKAIPGGVIHKIIPWSKRWISETDIAYAAALFVYQSSIKWDIWFKCDFYQ